MKELVATVCVLSMCCWVGVANATSACAVFSYYVNYRGSCETAVVFGRDETHKCAAAATYSLERDGHAVFGFYLPHSRWGQPGLSGSIFLYGPEKAKRPNLKNYRLALTYIETPDMKGPDRRRPARGTCRVVRGKKGVAEIDCHATTASGPIEFRFKSTEASIYDCAVLMNE